MFLELTLLTLPNIIRIVLPLSAFVASVYVTNRLTSDSEMVVVQATGFSPFRLARPVLVFGLIVAGQMIVSLILEHNNLLVEQQTPVNPMRILGVVLIVAGVIILRRF